MLAVRFLGVWSEWKAYLCASYVVSISVPGDGLQQLTINQTKFFLRTLGRRAAVASVQRE